MSLVEWGASGWKGINQTAAANPGWNQVGYDDSAWPEVQLPLGGGTTEAGGPPECPIHATYPPNTDWPSNTEYLLRRWFDGDDFTVDFTVDNHAWIYWDGVLVAEGDNETGSNDCPTRADHSPATGALGFGAHLLAIRCQDRGVETYFDCRVELTGGRLGFFVGHVGIGQGVGIA